MPKLQPYLLRKFHRSSFRSKLVLTYVLIIVIPVITAMFLSGIQLYKQTNSDYEEILQQLDSRTHVSINDFFANHARYSFFYLTNFKLSSILEKSKRSSDKEYFADANYMYTSMQQLVLINGSIAMISVLAPNGSIYGSQPEKAGKIRNTLKEIGESRLKNNDYVVHISKEANTKSTSHRISIVRYLSDLNIHSGQEGYAKVDIYDKAIENMLGGISNDGLKLGTMILSGETVVYSSNGSLNELDAEQVQSFTSLISSPAPGDNPTLRINWNNKPYLISSTVNPVTGWTVIHYIPVAQITDTFISNTLNYVLISILALIAALGLAFFFHRYFIHPILKLSGTMKIVDSEHLTPTVIHSHREDEIGRLINSYNAMIERIRTSRDSEITASSLQKKAEIKMLQSQINPHFLYNTLNAIHSIAELHLMEHISSMTKSLSSIYRYNVKYGDVVTIGKELENIEHYIQIQQIRFFNKFQVEYEIDQDVISCKILKFLIQPIIENSFYHGLEPKGGTGKLRLTIRKRHRFLYICVYDDGVGISKEKLSELKMMLMQDPQEMVENLDQNFGMRNVYARIKHFYGESSWMNIKSEEKAGTTIMIHIPYNREMDTDENISGR